MAIWVAWSGVGVVSGVAVWILATRLQAAVDTASSALQSKEAMDDPQADLAVLLQNILPAWQHHVDAVKGQTEAAVLQLANSFSMVLDELDSAGIASAAPATQKNGASSIGLLALCERELQPVVGSLTSVIDGKDVMMANIRNLANSYLASAAAVTDVQYDISVLRNAANQDYLMATRLPRRNDVPLPGTLALAGLGLAALVVLRRRRA